MITASRNIHTSTWSFKGKSTDTKPVESWEDVPIENGSTFFEMDKQEVYFYDGDTNTWLAQP